jgi:hypothetical protein
MGVCFLNPEQLGTELNVGECLPRDEKRKVILWGDSAIAHLYLGMREPLEKAGYSLGQLTASGCPPIIGVDAPQRPNCRAFNDWALPTIIEEKPDLLLMGAIWAPTPEMLVGLQRTIDRLREAGIKPVILGTPAIYRSNVPQLVADRWRNGDRDPLSGADMDKSGVQLRDDALRKLLEGRTDAKFIPVVETVCPGMRCPMVIDGGIPVQSDIVHLTPAGSKYFANILVPKVLSSN